MPIKITVKKPAPKSKTTYPDWIYDTSPIPDPLGFGERAVKWLRALKHPKNPLKGHAFKLDPWQERIVRKIYGPRNKDGTRIVKTVVMMLPRGNRKTSLGAALALLHTVGPEAVFGGQVISAAVDRNQAKLAFEEAAMIVEASDKINGDVLVRPSNYLLKSASNKSEYKAIASEGGAQHGKTPVFALVDELWAWPKRDLWEAIRSGMVKTPGSLMFIATTAGKGQENLAFDIVDYARKVARGDIDDPATLPILFETDSNADWQDEKVWKRANPGLAHGYPDIQGLRQLAREAINRPHDRESFKQLNLNMWADYSASPFVDMQIYDEGNEPINLNELEGEPCWIGCDLSSTSDLTAVVAAFKDDEDGFIVVPFFFCPADNLARRQEVSGFPYVQWAEDGFLEATPGNVVDYRIVENCIRDLCKRFDVREIAFDPYLAQVMLNNLTEDGFPAVSMRQGYQTMSPAIAAMERAIIGRRFKHGGHPVLRFCFDNIVAETDKVGNVTFSKKKKKDKIDGAVACAMAIGRASAGNDSNSIYDTPERAEGLLIF